MNNNTGREQLTTWSSDIWSRIDRAVHDEAKRTKVAQRILPLYGPLADGDDNVPADNIKDDNTTLTAQRGATTALTEIGVRFAMTQQQVGGEEQVSTAVTLATRATNWISRAEDLLIFQGQDVQDRGNQGEQDLFKRVDPEPKKEPNTDAGLLGAADEAVPVEPLKGDDGNPITDADGRHKYGENTFAKVAQAYSLLQAKGHYGPYALVLHADIFADAHAPLPTTLIMPADRIKALVGQDAEGRHMFYGTGALKPSTGLMFSLGGDAIDLVSGNGVVTTFMQKDTANMYQFRVVERFTMRLKDKRALVRLDFN
jgi:uncharacterized linocin/CFP29 family protein